MGHLILGVFELLFQKGINEVMTSACIGLVCIYIFICVLNENYGYTYQIC